MPAFPVQAGKEAGGGYMGHGPTGPISSSYPTASLPHRLHGFLAPSPIEGKTSYLPAPKGRQVPRYAIVLRMHRIATSGYNVNGNPNSQPRQVAMHPSRQDPYNDRPDHE